MQVRREKKWCLLIGIMLIISGLYFEDCKISAPLTDFSACKDFSYLTTVTTDIHDTDVCTSELLNVRGMLEGHQLAIQSTKHRKDARTSPYYLYQNTFSIRAGSSCSNSVREILLSDTQSNLITKYIHKSDGKKRLL